MIFVMLAGLLLSSGAFSYITLFVEASIKIADGQVSKIPPVVSSAQEGCGKPNVVPKIIRHKKAIQIRFFTVCSHRMFTIILIQIESKVYLDFYIFYSSFVLFVHKISCFMRCFSSHSCEIISAFFAAAASEKQTITAAMIIIIKTISHIEDLLSNIYTFIVYLKR